MRRAFRQPLAVAFALLVVTAAALGGAFVVNDDVTTLDGAADQLVQRNEAVGVTGAVIIGVATGAVVASAYHNHVETDPSKLNKTDKLETKKAVYDQISIQAQNNDIIDSAYSNYLADSKQIALMTGKKAYISALEQGKAEAEARNDATEAVEQYYMSKQEQLLTTWNTTMVVLASGRYTLQSAGASPNMIGEPSGSNYFNSADFNTTTSITLLNGSSMEVRQAGIDEVSEGWVYMDPTTGRQEYDSDKFAMQPPTESYDKQHIGNVTTFHNLWGDIQTYNQDVQSQLDSFVTATYDSYQQGDISTEDLVDPYLGSREYTPETSNTWSLRTLGSMGLNPPENLSSVGYMNVSTEMQTHRGVLMTDSAPSGGFTVGNTYNASRLNGSQWVALEDGGSVELSGEFTLSSATRSDGSEIAQNESITYRNITYETADMQEFAALQDQLDNLTAEIDARQQRQRNSGGAGWLPDFGSLDVGSVAPVVLIAGAALVLLARS